MHFKQAPSLEPTTVFVEHTTFFLVLADEGEQEIEAVYEPEIHWVADT